MAKEQMNAYSASSANTLKWRMDKLKNIRCCGFHNLKQ